MQLARQVCIRILPGISHFMLGQNVIFNGVFYFPWLLTWLFHAWKSAIQIPWLSRFSMTAWTLMLASTHLCARFQCIVTNTFTAKLCYTIGHVSVADPSGEPYQGWNAYHSTQDEQKNEKERKLCTPPRQDSTWDLWGGGRFCAAWLTNKLSVWQVYTNNTYSLYIFKFAVTSSILPYQGRV